ncbi:hypothetical protein MIT9_P0973 [Methylomarinovum caldicuralii]|uniref:Uncharacterized protein n=1 Tax=Methylomarinovum caldicuralii TaxID=438856 RepID=A0AAU9CEH2_9GAMM|nr:hypothetical protein [Methylomarinovum caldicuralii]BCX81395.1 hypothetical protein MIT9_P0973 [Methylomarinovum caldicuralii]
MTVKIRTLDEAIAHAKRGLKLVAKVQLAKRPITLKVHPDLDILEEQEGYLLGARFIFRAGDGDHVVDRVYVLGFPTEDPEETLINRNLANGFLKEDYRRLKEAGIRLLDEPYFEE